MKKVNIFQIARSMLPQMFKTMPSLSVVLLIITVLHGVSFGVITMLQQRFFDAAANSVGGTSKIGVAIIALLVLGVGYVINQVLNGVGNYIPNIIINKARGELGKKIHGKISKLSPAIFEDTDKLDFINKAQQGKDNALWTSFTLVDIFLFYLPYFIFMGWYLFQLKPILVVALVCVFIPICFSQLVRTKMFSDVEDKSAPVRREYDYYEECMVSREYYKETRLLGAFQYFRRKYIDSLDTLQKLKFKASYKTGMIELGMSILTVAGYITIIYLLFDSLMSKEISVGAFAAVFASIGLLYSIMEEVVIYRISDISKEYGTIRNYINFMDLPEGEGEDIVLPENYDIRLEQVTYAYPKADKNAVEEANLTIKAGETLAIVGENGSGKSTLIRLIMGLYAPQNGSVKYADYDASKVSLNSLNAMTSAVFQKYQRYQMLLSENIGISNVARKTEEEALDQLCMVAGVAKDNESYPQGYDTMLSREFDGVDLSGGQWQRIAIARGFFRDHRLIILDEPTAAIDPYEETRIYNQFAEISKDKTAIIVTHRLGSVKLADRVVVMKEGRIVQIGTHDELINQEGEYTRLYQAQEQWYKEEVACS
ncbi:MAG TPA: ABC transporter ATP-binding protein [Lachnospiraceae bacterium]|nr:ABC transporter ATP-binding protein [Lachnospiraceae bacterium]